MNDDEEKITGFSMGGVTHIDHENPAIEVAVRNLMKREFPQVPMMFIYAPDPTQPAIRMVTNLGSQDALKLMLYVAAGGVGSAEIKQEDIDQAIKDSGESFGESTDSPT